MLTHFRLAPLVRRHAPLLVLAPLPRYFSSSEGTALEAAMRKSLQDSSLGVRLCVCSFFSLLQRAPPLFFFLREAVQ